MKKIISLLSTLIISAVAFTAVAGPQVIVVGHASRTISILDIESKEIVWQYPLEQGEQCNSVIVLADGDHIAFSTQLNAKVVSLETKEVVWEHNIKGTEHDFQTHSVVPLNKGGFAVFTAGVPVEVIEVSKNFEITKELQLTCLEGLTNPHGMFRQISITKDGDYIVPWWNNGKIHKISRDGEIVETYPVGKNAFAVRELPNGNLFFGTGDDSAVMEYDTVNNCVVRELRSMSMNGQEAWLQYLSQSEEISKGRYMVANWVGHGGKHADKKTDLLPVLMVIDNEGNIEWCCTEQDDADLKFISGFYYSKKTLVK